MFTAIDRAMYSVIAKLDPTPAPAPPAPTGGTVVDVPTSAPPGSANFLEIASWVMWGAGVAIVLGVILAAVVLGLSGHSDSPTSGKKGAGVLVALIAAAIFGAAGSWAHAVAG